MIQIHPKRTYLNIDVVISNKGLESAIVEDSITHESFSLAPGEFRASRYPAGEHRININWASGKKEEQSFVVEDALKFGGSERKGTYVFDNNPWAIIVMRDRTYFLNQNTKEQFVEHNLSPDGILELSPEYLLFTTGHDCSFFSLQTMSFEKTVSSSDFVFCGNKHCILSSLGGLSFYRLEPQFPGERLGFIKCDEYVINEEDSTIYTFAETNGGHLKSLHLLSEPENGEYEQGSQIVIDGDFICFISCHTLLFTKSNLPDGEPNMLYGKNLSKMGTATLIYNGEQPISRVNGISVWDSSTYDKLYEAYWKDRNITGTGCRLKIDVIENSHKLYNIQTIDSVVVKDRKAENSVISSLFSLDQLIHKDNTQELFFVNKGTYDYVKCEKYSFVFYNCSYKKVYGELYFTNWNDPYTKLDRYGKTVYTTLDGFQIKCHEDKSLPSYGLFNIVIDGESFVYWLKTNKKYVGDSAEYATGVVVVSGGRSNVSPRFFFEDGAIIPVPRSTEDIIAHSATGTTLLSEKGGYYSFARYAEKNWHYSEDMGHLQTSGYKYL